CARFRIADLEHRRHATGGVSARVAHVVSADAHVVGVHLSDLEHAGVSAVGDAHSAGTVLPGGAARDCAERGWSTSILVGSGRTRHLCGCDSWPCLSEAAAPMGLSRLLHVVRKEFLELRQDPRLFGIVIMAPIVQLTMLGYAAPTDVRNVPLVVVDQDGTSESRDLVSRFEASQSFVVIDRLSSVSEIDAYLDTGRAWMALTIPAEYGKRIRAGTPTTVQVVADGTDANSTNVALGYAGALIADYARELATAFGAAPGPPLVSAEVRVWLNPQIESRDFMIPVIMALLQRVVTTNLSSMAIVRERELGTLEQLNVTPIARWELIAGKMVPYALIGFIDILLVVFVAVFWFEVPLRGSFTLLLVMCAVYLLTTLGLGLFVSTISS